jgi:hypothetical protein
VNPLALTAEVVVAVVPFALMKGIALLIVPMDWTVSLFNLFYGAKKDRGNHKMAG